MKRLFVIIIFLLAAICSGAGANGIKFPEGFIVNGNRTPSLNGGNTSDASLKRGGNFNEPHGTNWKIAVRGVRQIKVPRYAPQQKVVSLGEIQLPAKELTLADADKILKQGR